MYKMKLTRIQLYVHMPLKEQWETLSDGYKKFYIQEAKNLMRVRASSIMMSGGDSQKCLMGAITQAVDKKMSKRVRASSIVLSVSSSQKRLMSAITDAVDGKMDKLPKYQQFDRMELFISVQLFALDDSSDVPLIREMLQEHVFAKTPCFGAVHILIGSAEMQSMALFTFTEKDVQKTRVSLLMTGKKLFKQYDIPDPRDPQHLYEILSQLDEQVDEKLYEYLNKEYPLEDTTWEEAVENEKAASLDFYQK